VKRDVTEEERERRKRMQQAEAIKGGDMKQLERIRWERWNKVLPRSPSTRTAVSSLSLRWRYP
jgi:hypothetical protein